MALVFDIPFYLWFLFSIPLVIVIHIYSMRAMKKKALKFANFEAISRVTGQQVLPRNVALLFVRVLIVFFIVLAVSKTSIQYTGQSNDFDFVIALDSSSSMAAKDFFPNRLEAAKEEAINFLNSLNSKTNVGVISFSGTSRIERSITDDLALARSAIRDIEISNTGGTDLGEAIQTGTNMLIPQGKGKVLVLITDGRNNAGIPISQAIDYATKNDVVVYTIGMGTEEGGKIEGLEEAVFRLDEETLVAIAIGTDGEYFKVIDPGSLRQAYQNIASSTTRRVTTDLSLLLLILALLLLILEWFLSSTKYRILP
nr:VWA domain-containing protein [Candidatus Woesearchaeota archaeon]